MSKDSVMYIVKQYLKDNGFDGLYNGDDECACVLDDLEPCGNMSSGCHAGYQFPCIGGEYDFSVGSAEDRDAALKEIKEQRDD